MLERWSLAFAQTETLAVNGKGVDPHRQDQVNAKAMVVISINPLIASGRRLELIALVNGFELELVADVNRRSTRC